MTRKQIKLLRALGVDFSSSDYFEDTSWYNRQVKPTGPGTMTMLLESKKPIGPIGPRCSRCGKPTKFGGTCPSCKEKAKKLREDPSYLPQPKSTPASPVLLALMDLYKDRDELF